MFEEKGSYFNTPILFLIFNRPETTKIVFDQIRAARPSRLYLAADGPRKEKKGERSICEETRRSVLDNIDWDCEVRTLLRNENLGCGVAPSTAITWFFENEEAGIILEDDCLPSLSFFRFAEYCLQKYWHNPQVMHIGGNNFLDRKWGDSSYFYSAYNHIWGWATWRRAWELYNFNLQSFNNNEVRQALKQYFPRSISRGWYDLYVSLLKNKNIDQEYKWDFWDYQWTFCIWMNKGLCIYPNVNLVSNIGFGPSATHTFDVTHKFNNLPHHELESISSPRTFKRNKKADITSSENVFALKAKSHVSLKVKEIYGKFSAFWKGIKANR
ncbi:hypothetical protein CLV24_102402 [Pontibacter ummariensis]|uniref:Nucleotide-diphospho-sugar transferase n=1 Tax=Pontibacter ummariensis TaxID=1610492 RepID=A0A239BK55_9BACT|nr:hypothetical protein [Pontibacter ummariensis]PRY15775.1 hypothetical protein CLV24_102402 [Pontibacter ummariensis]SNS08597.1 hypothetical protein SAMN06296052_10210 [Pontibacter ummariensis]